MSNQTKVKIVRQMVNKLKFDLNINNKKFSNQNLINFQRNWPIVLIHLDNNQKELAKMYLQFVQTSHSFSTNKFIDDKIKKKL